MEKINLNNYKDVWRAEQSFSKQTLSKNEIQSFLGKKSKDITILFKKGLLMDIVLKAIMGISFVGILFLYAANSNVILWISVVLVITVLTLLYQVRSLKNIPDGSYGEDGVRSSLQSKLNYYYKSYSRSLYIGALSNAMIIISGSLYYFYFKYGELRQMDIADFVVFSTTIILSFVFGLLVQFYHHNFHIKQIKESLNQIDAETISVQTLKSQKLKRVILFWIAFIAITCGLLLLAYLILM